jgi:hypothetical protein
MAILNAQGTLYLVSGALVALLVRRARPSGAAHRHKAGSGEGLAVGRRASTGSSAR